MTQQKKEYLNHAFKWGSIVGFAYFVWNIIGFYSGFEKKLYFADIFFIFEIMLIFAMFYSYRKKHKEEQIKFGKMAIMGLILSLIISFFYIIYIFVRMEKLDALFFPELMNQVSLAAKQTMHIDYSKIITPNNLPFVKVSIIFAMYVGMFINTMIYTLITILFFRLNERMYTRK